MSQSTRRRRYDLPDTGFATAATKAALKLALIRLNDQLDESERLLQEELEELRDPPDA